MEAFEKQCLRCEAYFTSNRADKKYCSATCRQMAYFKRNGFSLSGNQRDLLPEENIKDSNGQKREEPIKYTSLAPDSDLEALIIRLTDTWQQQLSQQIEQLKKELDIKYGSISKQQEPAKLLPLSQSSLTQQKEYPSNTWREQPSEQIETLKQEFDIKYGKRPVDNGQKTQQQEPQRPEPETYKDVHPRFVKYIEHEFDRDESSYKLEKPLSYWSYEAVKVIQWVNLRLRCLLESLIKLSNYNHIDRHTLECINDAFSRLCKSKSYQSLPDSYPFKKMIGELITTVNQIYVKQSGNHQMSKVLIRITLKEKVRLVYARNILKKFTPDLKFSQLHFNE